jgi:hypothetical protein
LTEADLKTYDIDMDPVALAQARLEFISRSYKSRYS